MGKAVHVTERDFEAQVIKSEVPVLVDFWAEWCGPCRMIAPIVEDLAAEYEGRLKVVKVDVDQNNALAFRYGVMSIPTLGIFKGGQMVERLVGYMPKQELKKRIDPLVGSKVS
ncbi:MAG TPA: thioredoxin [bacterium]|nr:thioredoxin [bacterium]